MRTLAKRAIIILLAVLMTVSAAPAVSAEGTKAFVKRYEYGDDVFSDVHAEDWFFENVKACYEYGLMNGKGQNRFDPAGNISVAEACTIAARLHSITAKGTESFESTKPWYQAYITYCLENGILDESPAEPDAKAERSLFAALLCRSMPIQEQINNVPDGALPDISESDRYGAEIYSMYRAGILTGSDGKGTFYPRNMIKRSEVAAIVTRIADPSLRKHVTFNTLTVYVSAGGSDAGADGTESAPFATITAARDFIRGVDKSLYNGIDVVIRGGEYILTEAVEFGAEDSGTDGCVIRYIGEDGASIVGGIALHASDFSACGGDLVRYFPEEAREHIVMIDLEGYGITDELIRQALSGGNFRFRAPFLSSDGERENIARFPDDDWINFEDGVAVGTDGEIITKFANNTEADYYLIKYGEQYFDKVSSWTSENKKFVRARWNRLWCPDDSYVMEISGEKDEMKVKFAGGYEPTPGMVFYWYNVPEELDVPGEYMYDGSVLYYYPRDDFDSAVLTVPVSNGIFRLDGSDHIHFENLILTSCLGHAVRCDNVTDVRIADCDISATGDSGIYFKGENFNIDISGNYIHNIGDCGIKAEFGSYYPLKDSNSVIYNNMVRDVAVTGAYGYCITMSGVGYTASHNVAYDSNFKGIHIASGINALVEYNEIFGVCKLAEDVGVLSGDCRTNANVVVRYNYVHDCGPEGTPAKVAEVNPDYVYFPIVGIYYDGMSSYFTTYGNVVQAIDGGGILLNAGRGNVATGNLVVDVAYAYIDASDFGYSSNFKEDGTYKKMSKKYDDYVYSEEYKAINPEPAQLIMNSAEADPDDPMFYHCPANVVVKNNWCHLNKANRKGAFAGWGGAAYNIDEYVYKYARSLDDIDVPQGSRVNSNISTYSSRRESVDLEQLITETAAGVIEITWEQFKQIGIVKDDWHIDIPVVGYNAR